MSKKYFAQLPTNDFLPELKNRIERFHRYKEKIGEYKQWRTAHNFYFGRHVEGYEDNNINTVGEDNEMTAFGANHYRSYITNTLALSCSDKPSFEFRAKNTNLKALQQTRLANNILDSYLIEKRMDKHLKQAAEKSLVYSLAYMFCQWDTTQGNELAAEPVLDDAGQPILDEDGQPVRKIRYEGDVSVKSKCPWDVIHDVDLRDWTDCKWVIVKEFENKWDLAAQYPKQADDITGLSKNYDLKEYNIPRDYQFIGDDVHNDLIPVYYAFHLPSAAVPSGRFTKFLTSRISLYDGAYPYGKKLPVMRIAPGERFESVDGYSYFRDIIPLQRVYNIINSAIFTNQEAHGVHRIWSPGNANITSEQLGSNMTLLKGGDENSKPQPLVLLATPEEMFKTKYDMLKDMSTITGINSVVRGDPDHGLKSGVALGRLQSMAIQYSSNFQHSWANLISDTGTFLFYVLQQFADTKRMTAIAGKANKSAMRSWNKDDIDLIDQVICDPGNALTKTSAGREDLAEKLLDKGLIDDPTQFIQLCQTGQSDVLTDPKVKILELIEKENEILMDGGQPHAMVGHTHKQHIQKHMEVYNDPDLAIMAAAGDALATKVLSAVFAHIMEHINLDKTQDPVWFAVSGEQPMSPPLPPGGPGGQPPPDAGPGQQDPQSSPMMQPNPAMQPPEMPPPPPIPPILHGANEPNMK